MQTTDRARSRWWGMSVQIDSIPMDPTQPGLAHGTDTTQLPLERPRSLSCRSVADHPITLM